MDAQLLIIMLLTTAIHAADTSSFSIRLAGIRIKRLAVALSLNSIIALVSRTSNLIQAPLTGNLVDTAKNNPESILSFQLHFILLGGILGTAIGIILLPTLSHVGIQLLQKFDTVGSMGKLIRISLSLHNLRKIKFIPPRLYMIKRIKGVPIKLILLNIIATGIYTVSVLSSQYAAYIVPEYSTTAASYMTLVSGMSIVLMTILIDPKVALETDKAIRGEDSTNVKNLFGALVLSRLVGTILAQLLLIPSAYLISYLCILTNTILN